MDNEWEDLGRRAMACEGWHNVRPGWATLCDGRVLTTPGPDDLGDLGVMVSRNPCKSRDGVHCEWLYDIVPDLRDPATLGCVEHLASTAHGADYILCATPVAPRMSGPEVHWSARKLRGDRTAGGAVKCVAGAERATALVAALEAAPAQEEA